MKGRDTSKSRVGRKMRSRSFRNVGEKVPTAEDLQQARQRIEDAEADKKSGGLGGTDKRAQAAEQYFARTGGEELSYTKPLPAQKPTYVQGGERGEYVSPERLSEQAPLGSEGLPIAIPQTGEEFPELKLSSRPTIESASIVPKPSFITAQVDELIRRIAELKERLKNLDSIYSDIVDADLREGLTINAQIELSAEIEIAQRKLRKHTGTMSDEEVNEIVDRHIAHIREGNVPE